MRDVKRALAAALAAGVCLPAAADVVVIGAARDNTLYQHATGGVSNGAGEFLFTGMNSQQSRRRGLLMFDVASAVPRGATITGVTLILTCSQSASDVVTPVGLHRTLADWGEGTTDAEGAEGQGGPATPGSATWLHRFYGEELWASAGGDFAAVASAVQMVDQEGVYEWSSAGMVADVQAWLDGTAGNYGWTIVGGESGPSTAKRFGSRENPVESARPLLRIEFVPGPGVMGLAAGAGVWGMRRRRREAWGRSTG